MNSLNEVTLLGLVVNDPKGLKTDSGTTIATFQVKTQEQYTNRETQKIHQHNEWHDVKAFGHMAEKCVASIQEGSRVVVRGHNRREKWKDRNEQPHSRTVVLIDDLIVLDVLDGSLTSALVEEPETR